MSYKKRTTIIFSIALITFLALTVIAAAGDGLKIISPSSGANYTTISSILFNVSFINGTDITQPSNATFFINQSGNWLRIGNTSASNGCQVGATTSSCSVNITNTTIPDGIYSINATIYNATTSVSVIHAGNLSTKIIIDGTAPNVQEANFSSPLSGSNHSGTLILNVSVTDITIGVQTVLFNITNSTGQQNASYIATNSAGNYWNFTINTSHFPDGTYNITIFANDSLNNLNNSARVKTIIFDNTAPSASASCSPSSVSTGSNFPCSCSASDATSGVSSSSGSSTSPDGTSIQENSGVFTYTCSVTDLAGNTASSSVQYTVTSRGRSSASRGSSEGSGLSPPSTQPSNEKEQDSSVSSSEQNTDPNYGDSAKATNKTSKIILTIIILAISGIALAIAIKRRK